MNRAAASLRLALVAALALSTAAPLAGQKSRPFLFADVDFTTDCAPNAAFDRLIGVLLPGPSGDDGKAEPEIDEPLYNAVSGAVSHVLELNSEVPWHGLRLVGVRLLQGIESGPTNHSLVFADSPERVREVWNARGWNLPPAGEIRVLEDEAIFTAIGIEADGRQAAVTCFVD